MNKNKIWTEEEQEEVRQKMFENLKGE